MRQMTLFCVVVSASFFSYCNGADLQQLQRWDTASYPSSPSAFVRQMESDPSARVGSKKLLKIKIGQDTFLPQNGFFVGEQFSSPDGNIYKKTLAYHGFVQIEFGSTPLSIVFNGDTKNWLTSGFTTYYKEQSRNGMKRELIQNCKATKTIPATNIASFLTGVIQEVTCQASWHSSPKSFYKSWIIIYYYSEDLGIPVKTVIKGDPTHTAGAHPLTEITLINQYNKIRTVEISDKILKADGYHFGP